MRWTKRWRRFWRSLAVKRRPAPVTGFPTRPAPARWRGWRRLIAVYVFLGLLTGGVIALVATPGPALRSSGRRFLAAAGRGMGELVPATRFVLSTDQNLAREVVRRGLPLLRATVDPGSSEWFERLLEGVTGLKPGEPETFLRDTMIARRGARHKPGRDPEPAIGPEPELVPAQRTSETAEEPSPPGSPETGEEQPVPVIPRRTEEELRRYPWGTAPLVAIYHTHSSETYHGPVSHPKGRTYAATDHVWGKTSGMIAIGDELARVLTHDYRVPVVHSRHIHDFPVYRDAYANSAVTVKELLRKYPSLRIVLDVHRDGLANPDVDFITAVMGGERLARISLIVGRGQPGLPNPHWEQNLELAQRLHAKMEEMYPGLSRGVTVRNWPYNQELSSRALLLELGDHFNTKDEALKSAALLADCLAALLADQAHPTP